MSPTMRRLSDETLYLHVTTPLDEKRRKFFLVELEGQESLSGMFHYRLTLKTGDNNIDFKKIVGARVSVSIEQFSGTVRYINGVVYRFIQAENDGRFTTYYAEMRPWLWQLTLTTNSKIFQEMTVLDIIAAVFSENGFSGSDFVIRAKGTYLQREYCVQYQETAYNFVARLMENEGIFYFFEHTSDTHTLVLADDADAHLNCPGLTKAILRDVEPESDELIDKCVFEEQLIPNKFATDDFNFEIPETDLITSAEGKESGQFRIYEYPGGFGATSEGEASANKRMEIYELPQKILKGEGFCRAFTAGHKFNFEEHDRQELNQSYVLRSLSILATQERYVNLFEAFPADVPFRQPQTTKKPRIFGTQTAIVVGKSGEEIWPDKYGRVKVQFHWDQEGKNDENSSCWIRVAQIWAGKAWGTLFIPRMGAEVIVSFLDGDPDKPIIIGTVYNATQTLPYPMPDDKTRSTIKTNSSKGGGGFNEMRFEDKKGEEEIYIHAQKDMNVTVEHDRTTEILNDETTTVTKNRTVTIKEEHEKLTVEKGNRTVAIDKGNETLTVGKGNRTVEVQKGNETHEVKGKRDLTVTDKESHTNKDKFTQTVSGDFTLEVDGDLTIDVKGEVTIKSGKDMLHDSGMKLTNKSGMDLMNDAGMNLDNKAGMNLTNDGGINLDNKAGAMMTNKASAMQTVDGGGMLMVKGGIVKIG